MTSLLNTRANCDIMDACDTVHSTVSPGKEKEGEEEEAVYSVEELEETLSAEGDSASSSGDEAAPAPPRSHSITYSVYQRELSLDEVRELKLQKLLRELREAGAPNLDQIRRRDEEVELVKAPYFKSTEELYRCLVGSDDEDGVAEAFHDIPTDDAGSPEADELDDIPLAELIGCQQKLDKFKAASAPVTNKKRKEGEHRKEDKTFRKRFKTKRCSVSVERLSGEEIAKHDPESKKTEATSAGKRKSIKKTDDVGDPRLTAKNRKKSVPPKGLKSPSQTHATGNQSREVPSDTKTENQPPRRSKWTVTTAMALKKRLAQEEGMKTPSELSGDEDDSTSSPESSDSIIVLDRPAFDSGHSVEKRDTAASPVCQDVVVVLTTDDKKMAEENQDKPPLKTEQNKPRRPGPKSKTRPREISPPPKPKSQHDEGPGGEGERASPILPIKRRKSLPIPSLSGSSSSSSGQYVPLPLSEDSSSDEESDSHPNAKKMMSITEISDKEAGWVKQMRDEMKSDPPNLAKLKSLLVKTKEFRLRYLRDWNYDFKIGMRMFPALKNYILVKYAYNLLNEGVPGGRMEFLEKSLRKPLYESCLLPKKFPPGFNGRHGTWEKAHIAATDPDITPKKRLTLGMICFVFFLADKQEKVMNSLIFTTKRGEEFDPLDVSTPAIVVDEDELESEEAKSMWVYAEGCRYVKVPNFYQGILTVYALHYVFNVVYPKNDTSMFKKLDQLAGIS